jgi:hypothetical protein
LKTKELIEAVELAPYRATTAQSAAILDRLRLLERAMEVLQYARHTHCPADCEDMVDAYAALEGGGE